MARNKKLKLILPAQLHMYLLDILKLKGNEHASLQRPPNHKLFDTTAKPISTVLQRRMAAQNSPSGSSAPIFNFTLGNEIINILCPPAPQPVVALVLPPANITPNYEPSCPLLLHHSCVAWQDMPLSEFCTKYGLGLHTLQKFEDSYYTDACVLQFVTIDELKQMEFHLGEIAGLRDVVELWLVLNNAWW